MISDLGAKEKSLLKYLVRTKPLKKLRKPRYTFTKKSMVKKWLCLGKLVFLSKKSNWHLRENMGVEVFLRYYFRKEKGVALIAHYPSLVVGNR